MKKVFTALLLFLLINLLPLSVAALEPDDITAASAVLIDADTGQVLYDKNMHDRREPASITKVMTGMLVLEAADVNEQVTVTDSVLDIPRNTSHIALTEGEVLPVGSALYAMMLPSANDAALALAEHVAGSESAFAALMNARAEELGALESHFVNPHGLSDDNHYTTAYDMALITRAAIHTPGFLNYFGAGRHTIPATNKQSEERPFTNQNYMLLPDMWIYTPEVIGGKVGYTDEARHTMTSAATRDGRTLIAVVLGCGIDQKFDDTLALFEYGFDEFAPLEVPIPAELLELSVPVSEEGEVIGKTLFAPSSNSVTLLAPLNTSPSDISFESRLPTSMEADGEDAALVLTVPAPVGSPLTVEIPLFSEVQLDEVPSVETVPQPDSPDLEETPSSPNLLWLFTLVPVLLLLLWVLLRRYKMKRRAAARRLRQERVARERRKAG
ncbi:MAG: D-alanyl-D-alanine carboxypeptidase family protein [Oscillospiraceae bacterium]